MSLRPGRRVLFPSTTTIFIIAATGLLVGLLTFTTPALMHRLPMMSGARSMVSEALYNVLHLPVHIDNIDIVMGGNLRLKGISLTTGNNSASLQANADQLVVDLSLWQLLCKRDVAAAIKRVIISDLVITTTGDPEQVYQLLPLSGANSSNALSFPVIIKKVTISGDNWQVYEKQITLNPASAASTKISLSKFIVTSGTNGNKLEMSITGSGVILGSQLQQIALRVDMLNATAYVSGQVNWGEQGAWNTRINVTQLRLPIGYGPIKFTPLTAVANIIGPFATPTADICLNQGPAKVNGKISWQAPRLMLNDGQGTFTQGVYKFTGWYDTQKCTINADVFGEKLPAGEALAWAGLNWPITGSVSGQVHINGPINKLTYSIDLQAIDGTAWKHDFNSLQAHLRYHDKTTTLNSLTAQTAGGRISGHGQVHDTQLQLAFTGESLSTATVLTGIRRWFNDPSLAGAFNNIGQLDIRGLLQGEVQISGTVEKPKIVADVQIPRVQMAEVSAGSWRAQIKNIPGMGQALLNWELTDFQASLGAGSLQAQGVLQFGSTPTNNLLHGTLTHVSGEWLTQISTAILRIFNQKTAADGLAQIPVQLRKSMVGGSWQLFLGSGLGRQKNISANINLNTVVGALPVTLNMQGDGWLGRWQIAKLALAAADGTAQFKGSYNGGKLQVNGNYRDLPAALIGDLANLPQSFSGKLQGDVQALFGTDGLTGKLSWQAASLSIDSSQLTKVSGSLLATEGRLRLKEWRGSAAGRQVQLDGWLTLPAALSGSRGLTANAVDLTLDIPQGPLGSLVAWLSIAPSLSKWGAYLQNIDGTGRAQLHVVGSPGAFTVNGEASITGGKLTLPTPWGQVEQLEMNLQFNGDTIKLTKVSGKALGGYWTAAGSVRLQPDKALVWQTQVSGKNLKPSLPGMSGQGDVNLNINGPIDGLQIGGAVSLKQGEIDLMHLHLPGVGAGGYARFNPHLDFNITAQQLRVKANSLLNAVIAGTLRLNGTWQEPTLNGQLNADHGQLNYLGTNFVIDEAQVDFAPYRGVLPSLALSATAWSGQHVVSLRMNGQYPSLQAQLHSDPPLPQQDILALLSWPGKMSQINTSGVSALGQGLIEVLQGHIQSGLVEGVESTLRYSLGLDQLQLKPNFNEHNLRILAGKYVAPRLYLTYGRTIFDQPRDELHLEYRMNNGWKLSGGLDENGGMSVGIELKTKF